MLNFETVHGIDLTYKFKIWSWNKWWRICFHISHEEEKFMWRPLY